MHTRAAGNHTGTLLLAHAANMTEQPSFDPDRLSASGRAVRRLLVEHHPELAHIKKRSLNNPLSALESPFGPVKFELKVTGIAEFRNQIYDKFMDILLQGKNWSWLRDLINDWLKGFGLSDFFFAFENSGENEYNIQVACAILFGGKSKNINFQIGTPKVTDIPALFMQVAQEIPGWLGWDAPPYPNGHVCLYGEACQSGICALKGGVMKCQDCDDIHDASSCDGVLSVAHGGFGGSKCQWKEGPWRDFKVCPNTLGHCYDSFASAIGIQTQVSQCKTCWNNGWYGCNCKEDNNYGYRPQLGCCRAKDQAGNNDYCFHEATVGRQRRKANLVPLYDHVGDAYCGNQHGRTGGCEHCMAGYNGNGGGFDWGTCRAICDGIDSCIGYTTVQWTSGWKGVQKCCRLHAPAKDIPLRFKRFVDWSNYANSKITGDHPELNSCKDTLDPALPYKSFATSGHAESGILAIDRAGWISPWWAKCWAKAGRYGTVPICHSSAIGNYVCTGQGEGQSQSQGAELRALADAAPTPSSHVASLPPKTAAANGAAKGGHTEFNATSDQEQEDMEQRMDNFHIFQMLLAGVRDDATVPTYATYGHTRYVDMHACMQ